MALAWRQIYVANRRVRENKKKVSKNKNYYDRSCLAPESMRGQYDNGVCVVANKILESLFSFFYYLFIT